MSRLARPTPLPAGPGQESVWDYPRPPRLEASPAVVEVTLGGVVVANTDHSLRVLETSHPPVYYLPMSAFLPGSLRPTRGESYCEWKGVATYFDVVAAGAATGAASGAGGAPVVAAAAAWGYPNPTGAFAALVDHVALYPAAMDRCTVDGEVVVAQPGTFYGGWITSAVVGPFKGEPGSQFW